MNAFNRFIVALLGLGLAAAGVILAVEAMLVGIDRQAWLIDRDTAYQFASQLSWDESVILVVSISLIGIGALLLLAQLYPRARHEFDVADTSPHRVSADRHGLTDLLIKAASVSGVTAEDCHVGRRRVRIYATSAVNLESEPTRMKVQQAAEKVLSYLKPRHRRRVSVELEASQ